ncbi:Uncharacterized protein Nst1_340 [Candidatus Nanobsidianus stetteri]|uniref:Uncharacterized protein n=1 Tax=Nanobsidianus stetteri TaxID=1294122 RepID=R1FU32_NANST|nr:Uncharacterized protein Nst1_340 [Candidatus Nanobsidianus stetteri]
MALAAYVNQTLDTLLNRYISEISRLKGLTTDDFAKESLDADIKTYSEIMGAMKEVSCQLEGQLDPKVNSDLKYVLENFVSKALKDNEDLSQLYRKILDAYNQEIFSKGDEALVILLSKIYWETLKILGNPDPINGQYYRNVSRQDRENAAKNKGIIEELLGEALLRHWTSRGKKITKGEIMNNLASRVVSFYKAWDGVKGKIVSDIEWLTPSIEVKDAVEKLVMELDKSYLSFIQGLIIAAYNKRSDPEHIITVLKYLNGKDFFKNVFSEIYNDIGSYINQLQPQIAQYLQLNQPAGQQQGQQGNQPQQPPQVQNQPMQPKISNLSSPLQKNNLNIPQPKVIKSSP